jgi:PIN domain nuclease of toxin-antitoxin system
MRLLLDTHVFIWWNSDYSKLSSKARNLIEDENNELILSVVSVWEMQIKLQLGKLPVMPASLDIIISRQQSENALAILPVQLEHVFAIDDLPLLHRDPFDRMLVAQAKAENLPLVTHDAMISQYPITIIW